MLLNNGLLKCILILQYVIVGNIICSYCNIYLFIYLFPKTISHNFDLLTKYIAGYLLFNMNDTVQSGISLLCWHVQWEILIFVSPAEIVASIPTGGMDVCMLWVLCCQVEVSATSLSHFQRSPTDCGVSLYVI